MGKPTRPPPNVDDPLSEPTVQRRLWAAYLQAGYTRSSFARAIGIRFHTLDAWDTEKSTPDLENFAKAALLLPYTADELLYGHVSRAQARDKAKLPEADALTSILIRLANVEALLLKMNERKQAARARGVKQSQTLRDRARADVLTGPNPPTDKELAAARARLRRYKLDGG